MVHHPYFAQAGIDTIVAPIGCQAPNFPTFLRALFTLENIRGALSMTPHKVTTVGVSRAAITRPSRR